MEASAARLCGLGNNSALSDVVSDAQFTGRLENEYN
jgi:hypothetical protein